MLSVLSCLALDHDPAITALAVIILAIGSISTMRLFARVRRTESDLKILWLCLTGIIGGGTVWSTHFVAMSAYESDLILGYDPALTLASLLIAVVGVSAAFALAATKKVSLLIETGGVIFGLSVAAMHYTGIAAMAVSGLIASDLSYVIASLVLVVVFGGLAMSRIARPVTRFCKYGASVSMIVCVAALHYTAMTGMTVEPFIVDTADSGLISGQSLGVTIFIVMLLLLLVASLTYSIDMKNAEHSSRHVKHLSLQDPLTCVPNRRGAEYILDEMLDMHVDDTSRIAVLAIDLDRFREVNNLYGQGIGDQLLKALAQRLVSSCGAGEHVGRIGGDHFIAIKQDVYSRHAASSFAARIAAVLDAPVAIDELALQITASIGSATYPDDGTTSDKLMEHAALAAARAKSEGGGRIVAYEEGMDQEARERSLLARDLAFAPENGELEVYYQLQNDTESHEIIGVEALLRWHHPVNGMVSPGVFIPIAEENGMITKLGNWVLETACAEAAGWAKPINVAVNVAAAQLEEPGFVERVRDVLAETGLPPSRLELEITESGIIADMGSAVQVIRRLKLLGVKVAMDDYGTGYSSLSTLQSFPFDKIKIDRAFVSALDQSRQSEAIVQATIIMAKSLDIPVLAEGVETEAQLNVLRTLGCNQIQGFLFGKPMPMTELKALLENGEATTAVAA